MKRVISPSAEDRDGAALGLSLSSLGGLDLPLSHGTVTQAQRVTSHTYPLLACG